MPSGNIAFSKFDDKDYLPKLVEPAKGFLSFDPSITYD